MQALKRIAIASSGLMGLLALLVGCSTLRPLWEGKGLDGYPARSTRVIVSEAYTFKPGLMTHTLPAGTYTFVLEDYNGAFFQSPSKLLLSGVTGTTQDDGGLLFKGGVSTEVYEYIVTEGSYSLRKLPSDFKFRIERTP